MSKADDIERGRQLLAEVRGELRVIRDTLGTLIVWMAQSANSPINRAEAEKLLERLERQ